MQYPNSPNPYDNRNPSGGQPPYGQPPYGAQPPYSAPSVFGGAVTQDERTMAMLAHLLQIFCGFLGPLIIFLVKKNQSKFVAYHALQALVWQIGYMVFMFGGFFVALVSMVAIGNSHQFPVGILLFWLMAMVGGLSNLILGIVYTIKAYNGEWSSYPLIGN